MAWRRRGARRRRTYRRVTRRNTYRRSSRGRGRRRTHFPLQGVPKSRTARLRYAITFTQNVPTTGVAQIARFSANGIFDCDITGGVLTHSQPMGYDQLMERYDHYIVVGSKMTTTFMQKADTGVRTACFLQLTDTGNFTAANTNYQNLLEFGTRLRVIGGANDSENGRCTLVSKYSPKKFMKGWSMDNPNFWGSVGANPSEDVLFEVGCCPTETLDDCPPLLVTVLIEYLVVAFERRVRVFES